MFQLTSIATIWMLGGMTAAMAAFDAYLLIERDGPVSTDATHSWVEILGFEQELENTPNIGSISGGGGTGVARGKEASLQMASDHSIARMMSGLAKGETFTLTLHIVRPPRDEVRASVMTQFVFRDTLFSKIVANGATGDDDLGFDVSFQYGKLEVTHTEITVEGQASNPTAAGWNFIENIPISVPNRIPDPGDYDDVVSPPPPDPDRDGDFIPNIWETTYNLDPDNLGDASNDPDKDGFTNRHEYIAGTHPREANSFFRTTMTKLSTSPGVEVEFTWSAVANRTYTVQASSLPGSGFTLVHTITTTADGPQTYRPPSGAGPYFRLSVRE